MRKFLVVAVVLVLLLTYSRVPGHGPRTARADDSPESLVVVTHVDAIPKFTEAGRALLRQFVEETRKDPGLSRIDVYEELSRPNHSTVVEVWESRKAYEAHLEADHTRAYRAKLQPMLGSPFDERLHRPTR